MISIALVASSFDAMSPDFSPIPPKNTASSDTGNYAICPASSSGIILPGSMVIPTLHCRVVLCVLAAIYPRCGPQAPHCQCTEQGGSAVTTWQQPDVSCPAPCTTIHPFLASSIQV